MKIPYKKSYIILIVAIILVSILFLLLIHKMCYLNLQKCKNITQLNNLLGIELEDYTISDINYTISKNDNYSSTMIDIEIKDNNSKLFNFFDTMPQIPPTLISYLKMKGIAVDKIDYMGVKYKELQIPKLFLLFGEEYRPYEIWLISINNDTNDKLSNLSIISDIPYKIDIDIENIIHNCI